MEDCENTGDESDEELGWLPAIVIAERDMSGGKPLLIILGLSGQIRLIFSAHSISTLDSGAFPL